NLLPRQRRERLALDQLHHQIGAALELADVVERDDAGVVEPTGGAGFAEHAGTPRAIAAHLLGQQLDRDLPAESLVDRAIDVAHAARAERGHDAVVGNPLHGLPRGYREPLVSGACPTFGVLSGSATASRWSSGSWLAPGSSAHPVWSPRSSAGR